MFDPELFGQAMAETIQKAIAPLREEVADLRRQLAESKSIEGVVRGAVAEEVLKLPTPKDADEGAIAERVTQAIKGDLDGWKQAAESNIKAPELPDIQGMVDSAVSEAVKAIPVPRDGKCFTFEDAQPYIGEAVGKFVEVAERCIADAEASLNEAIKRANEVADGLRQPEDGKSITLDDVAPLIGGAVDDLRDQAEAVLKEMEAATETAKQATKDAIEKAASLRQPEDGKSVTVEDVRPFIEDQIKQAVSMIPTPKDGIGMAGTLIDRDGNLIVTMTNGEAKNLGPVVGRDGLSLDSFSMEYDADEHEVVIKAACNGRTQEVRYPAGGIRPAGYWREGTKAKAGEAWTHDGHAWFAKRDTSAKPDAKSDDWQLAVRRGRDGDSVVRRVKDGPAQPIKLGGSDAGND